jgi:mono/diheme cytochrome c family protein
MAGSSRRRRHVGAAVLALGFAAPVCAQAPSAFEAVVAPIFEARCVSCHGTEKTKGRLALHTWELVAKGGSSGPLWVAGKPAESELVRRLLLPADDEEHMPPREEPQLAKEEIALLERWVAAGASPRATVAELGLTPELARFATGLKERLPAPQAAGGAKDQAWELDPTAVARARGELARTVAELQRRFPGALAYASRTSAELHFTAVGLGREFGDAELAQLQPLAGSLVLLDLSGTAITDAAGAGLRELQGLRVLRLNRTAAGDGVLAALAQLPRLETVALHGAAMSERGLAALRGTAALRRLHAGGAAGEAAARLELPIVAAGSEPLDLPVPGATPPAGEGTAKPQ